MAKKEAPAAAPAKTTEAAPAAPTAQEAGAAGQAPVVHAEGRRPLSEDEKIAAVADLLSGKASGGGDDEGTDDAGQAGKQAPGQQDGGEGGAGVADPDEEGDGEGAGKADASGKKAPARDEAFYAQEVALPDGDVVTVGQLKDAYAQRQASELAMTEREGKIARQIGEAQHLSEALREHVPPQFLHGAAQELDQRISREAAALLEIYPTWRQETARQADHGLVLDMVDRLAGGKNTAIYHKIEAFLQQPTDREVMQVLVGAARVLGTASKRQRELERVRAEKPAARHAAPARPAAEADRLAARAKQTHRADDQIRAVEALLR